MGARLQILTVDELIASKRIDMPPIRQTDVKYKEAPKVNPAQPTLPILTSAWAKANVLPIAQHRRPKAS
jgi:hypothetical protein